MISGPESLFSDPQRIIDKTHDLVEYGAGEDLCISTRFKIPGIKPRNPHPSDECQRQITTVGPDKLSVVFGDEEDTVRFIVDTGEDTPRYLEPEQVETVAVDHPYGSILPLNGSKLNAQVKMRWEDSILTIGYSAGMMAYALASTVRAWRGDTYPGVHTYELPPVIGVESQDPALVHLSQRDDGLLMVSSQFHDESNIQEVVPWTDTVLAEHFAGTPPLSVDMAEYPAGILPRELFESHVARHAFLGAETGGDFEFPTEGVLTPFQADKRFLQIIANHRVPQ